MYLFSKKADNSDLDSDGSDFKPKKKVQKKLIVSYKKAYKKKY